MKSIRVSDPEPFSAVVVRCSAHYKYERNVISWAHSCSLFCSLLKQLKLTIVKYVICSVCCRVLPFFISLSLPLSVCLSVSLSLSLSLSLSFSLSRFTSKLGHFAEEQALPVSVAINSRCSKSSGSISSGRSIGSCTSRRCK